MQCLFVTSKSQFLGKATSIFLLHEMKYTIPPGYKPEWGDRQTLGKPFEWLKALLIPTGGETSALCLLCTLHRRNYTLESILEVETHKYVNSS